MTVIVTKQGAGREDFQLGESSQNQTRGPNGSIVSVTDINLNWMVNTVVDLKAQPSADIKFIRTAGYITKDDGIGFDYLIYPAGTLADVEDLPRVVDLTDGGKAKIAFMPQDRIGVEAGTSAPDVYVVDSTYMPEQKLYAGQEISWLVVNTNVGGSTINVDGQGIKALLDVEGNVLLPSAISANSFATAKYDGAAWRNVTTTTTQAQVLTDSTFTLADHANTFSLTYTPPNIMVTKNGRDLLRNDGVRADWDYTATDSLTLVLRVDLVASDLIQVFVFEAIQIADVLAKSKDLSDLLNIVTARANLSVDSSAEVDTKIITALTPDNARMGLVDYNDLATQTVPISVTGGGGAVVLTNDTLGPNTLRTFLPAGVTDVWDEVLNEFDWSELSLGDVVDIRLSLELTTTSVNTEISIDLHLGTGASSYVIPFVVSTNFKNTGVFVLNRFNGIYMGDLNTKDNGGQFKISADNNCSIKVSGWYCKIIRRGT